MEDLLETLKDSKRPKGLQTSNFVSLTQFSLELSRKTEKQTK